MTKKCYHYVAYGLGIQSELWLPELEQDPEAVEINIRLGRIKQTPLEADPAPYWSWADDEKVILHWDEVGTFLIRAGSEIIVQPDPAAPEARVRLFLLGAAFGVLLHQRGLIVLHSSAVALHDSAVAFIGGKGWGKSTMAGMLHASGHRFIADDVLAIELKPSGPVVRSGFPQLKLWPDAVTSLGQVAETAPQLYPQFEKRNYRVRSGFSNASTSLCHLYFLGLGSKPTIELVPANQAVLELLPHWYCARFSVQVRQHFGSATRFLQCANLAQVAPIYRLKRPRSLSILPELAQLIEEHCRVVAEQNV